MVRIHRGFRQGNNPKLERQKKYKTYFGIFIGFLFVWGIMWVFHTPRFSIQEISVVGIEAIPQEVIEDLVRNELTSSYAVIFPKRNVFIYPKQNLLALLAETEPRIESVTARAPLGELTHLTINIKERNSNLLWCLPDNECLSLDEDGVIYAPYTSTTTNNFFVVKKEGAQKMPLGSRVVFPDELSPIFIIKDALEKDSQFIEALILKEGDYSLVTKDNTKILFNKEDDLDIVADNLYTLFRSEVVRAHGTSSVSEWLSGIEYIDARFGKKIFYKER